MLKTSPFIATVWVILVLINAGAGAAQLLVLRETVNTLADAYIEAVLTQVGLPAEKFPLNSFLGPE